MSAITAGISNRTKGVFTRLSWSVVRCAFYFVLAGALASHLPVASAAPAQAVQKVVQGKVIGSSGAAQQGAIVYLKNGKTGDIKSFISTADGSFRFGQLSPDVDYEIWADYQGKKSATRSVSSFDSKKLLDYQLKVDTGK
jgi:hypothetical protein